MNRIIVPKEKIEARKAEIEHWLNENAGVGSARYGSKEGTIQHWLNGDDYCYYNQWTLGDLGDLDNSDTVFIFRNEKVATEFALRFA
jgi:hypothetical protein